MKNALIKFYSYFSGVMVLGIVIFIFSYILLKGCRVINLEFLFSSPKGMPLGTEGGILPAITGSIYLGLISALFSSIFSVSTSIYLSFYCKNKIIYNLICFGVQSISGIPSIVLGLFGYSFLIMNMGIKKSLLSAGITLSIMIIPFITLRLEKIFKEVSSSIINSSLALGVSKIHTIVKIVIPMCRRQILTTIALSSAYAIGATAPIMFTGAVIYAKDTSLMSPFMALPYHLYILINEGFSMDMAYGTAFVLVVLLLFLNLLCQFTGRKRR